MKVVQFIGSRIAQLLLVLFAVTLLTFVGVNTLGDPLVNVLGPLAAIDCSDVEAGLVEDISTQGGTSLGDCAIVAQRRAEFNLDDPVLVRYGKWVGDAAQGDFGSSFSQQRPVSDIIKEKLPVTVRMAVFALVLSLVISVPWALLAAFRANRPFDRGSTVVSFGMLAIPNFAVGVILLFFFAVRLQWFPSRYEPDTVFSQFKSLFLPSLTLALPLAATYQRLLRTDLIGTLQEDFVHMARAKGMPPRHIMTRHALRPSMFSMITVFGINTGALLGGTLVIERIFTVPGIGSEAIESIVRDDFPTVLAIVLIIVTAFVVMNMLVDILYSFLDPRVRS